MNKTRFPTDMIISNVVTLYKSSNLVDRNPTRFTIKWKHRNIFWRTYINVLVILLGVNIGLFIKSLQYVNIVHLNTKMEKLVWLKESRTSGFKSVSMIKYELCTNREKNFHFLLTLHSSFATKHHFLQITT